MLSMTGFGRGEAAASPDLSFTVEVSSVNRKQFELRFLAPPEFSALESTARQVAAEYYSRGAIQLRLLCRRGHGAHSVQIDTGLLAALIAGDLEARRANGLPADRIDVETLMQLPGVVCGAANDTDPTEYAAALASAATAACEAALAMRKREGEVLRRDLEGRAAKLEEYYAELKVRCAAIPGVLRARLAAKLEEAKLPTEPDDPALLRELLFYIDRADVSEELARLDSHFKQLRGFFAATTPCGRSLDFLAQEFFREITTLGNKAASPEISHLVVDFKSELEKLREQIQNVE